MTTQPFSETVTDIGPPSRYTIRHERITPHHVGARADCAGEGRLAPRRVFDGVLTAGRDGRVPIRGEIRGGFLRSPLPVPFGGRLHRLAWGAPATEGLFAVRLCFVRD